MGARSQIEGADSRSDAKRHLTGVRIHVLRYFKLVAHKHRRNATAALDDLQTT